MIKIIGVIITVVSGFLGGNALCIMEKEKLFLLEELSELIFYIYINIEKSTKTLDRIFGEFFGNREKPYLEEMFKNEKGLYGEKLMKVSRKLCSEYVCLELSHLTKTLGTLNRDAQLKALKDANDVLESHLSEKRKEYANKKRVYKTVSAIAAAVFAILLV